MELCPFARFEEAYALLTPLLGLVFIGVGFLAV
jgi:hypothetical protein